MWEAKISRRPKIVKNICPWSGTILLTHHRLINQSISQLICQLRQNKEKLQSIGPHKGSLACDGGRLNIKLINIEEKQQKTKQ